nr:hypothetical protein Iba_chr04dCG14840 [Ipomoea batatas]
MDRMSPSFLATTASSTDLHSCHHKTSAGHDGMEFRRSLKDCHRGVRSMIVRAAQEWIFGLQASSFDPRPEHLPEESRHTKQQLDGTSGKASKVDEHPLMAIDHRDVLASRVVITQRLKAFLNWLVWHCRCLAAAPPTYLHLC